MKNPRSKSTATSENAMTKEEIDARLASTAQAHLATFRPDGMIHLTPIWFDWDGSAFRLTLGAGRVHLGNLAADSRVTILVDQDPRPQQGLAAGAWAIECRGTADLSTDEQLVEAVTHSVFTKALGRADADLYTKPLMAEGRTVVTITPEVWHTWDYNKVE
jgi:PPOX class probable F420-dependent enzyme